MPLSCSWVCLSSVCTPVCERSVLHVVGEGFQRRSLWSGGDPGFGLLLEGGNYGATPSNHPLKTHVHALPSPLGPGGRPVSSGTDWLQDMSQDCRTGSSVLQNQNAVQNPITERWAVQSEFCKFWSMTGGQCPGCQEKRRLSHASVV